jgi:hypothetical protein
MVVSVWKPMKKFLKTSANAPALHFGLSELPEGQYPPATGIGHRLITIGYINHAYMVAGYSPLSRRMEQLFGPWLQLPPCIQAPSKSG